MVDKSFRLRKSERLCSETSISELFKDNNSFFVYPFRVVWRESSQKHDYPVQVAISVGKKRIRRAVKRNYLKRRIKEAYRLNKNIIYNSIGDKSIDMMFIYMTSEIKEFSDLEPAVVKVLNKLKSEVLGSSVNSNE